MNYCYLKNKFFFDNILKIFFIIINYNPNNILKSFSKKLIKNLSNYFKITEFLVFKFKIDKKIIKNKFRK